MSLHNFNPNNKSWKMYSNTITSISGDNLTIKPYDGKNLLLEVSGNNNIFFKRGNISYGLDDLIGANITLTSVSGDIIPSNDNTFKLGDVSKNWSNAYINDISVNNIESSGNIIPHVSESGSLGTQTNIWSNAYIKDLSGFNIELVGNIIPYVSESGSLGTQTKIWNNAYINDISVTNISVSGNIIPYVSESGSLGTQTNIWNNAYIKDLSGLNIELVGNIIPYASESGSLGTQTKRWSNAYICDLSVSNISVSGNIFIPSNSINSSHIINGSILTEDICNNTITRNKLSELTTNLMIFNSDTSTTTLVYTITLNTAGTTTTYFNYPWGGIGIGMTHSLRVCIPSITTQISVLIDTDGKSVSANEVFNGAIQVGTFTDNTLTFTFDPDGYDNIQIGFVIEDSVPPANTGFWGTFVVQNVTTATHRYMDVHLAYNDIAITSTQRIHGDTNYTFNVAEENRLPLVSSLLQLKVTMQENTESLDLDAYDGFSIESFTSNPLDEENTLDMLIDENNYENGECNITFNVTYDPP